MQQSETIGKLNTALASAQAEIGHATKDAQNSHLHNRYATLGSTIDEIKPVLAKHGLAVVQMPGFDADSGVVTLETMLTHTSGEWIRGCAGAPAPKRDPQGVGSAVTYLRRYSLAALFNMSQEDDDGEGAKGNGKPAPQKRQHDNYPSDTPRPVEKKAEPWMVKMPIGRKKGTLLGDLSEKDLESAANWIVENNPEKFAQLRQDIEDTLERMRTP